MEFRPSIAFAALFAILGAGATTLFQRSQVANAKPRAGDLRRFNEALAILSVPDHALTHQCRVELVRQITVHVRAIALKDRSNWKAILPLYAINSARLVEGILKDPITVPDRPWPRLLANVLRDHGAIRQPD